MAYLGDVKVTRPKLVPEDGVVSAAGAVGKPVAFLREPQTAVTVTPPSLVVLDPLVTVTCRHHGRHINH